jgi:hypothetical protein
VTVTHLLNDTGNAALWLSGASIVIWIVQYSLLAAWWRSAIGVTLIGLAVCMLAIYIPSLMALADPADYAGFASTTWYLYLTVGIVVASAGFQVTRIVTWERIRRRRYHGHLMLPADLITRIAELEAELEACRQQQALPPHATGPPAPRRGALFAG